MGIKISGNGITFLKVTDFREILKGISIQGIVMELTNLTYQLFNPTSGYPAYLLPEKIEIP